MSEEELDPVFKALADESRRRILDIIKNRPGISVGELTEFFEFSRFAVMKHLKVLSEANLLKIEKKGKFRSIHLNAIPIQMIYDRWISQYGKHWASALTRLKYDMEGESKMEEVKQIYTLYIKTNLDKLWDTLIQSKITPEWFAGMAVTFEPKVGAKLTYDVTGPDGNKMSVVQGKVLEFDPKRKLVYTFKLDAEPKAAADRESRVSYELEPVGDSVKLTVIHDDFDGKTPTYLGTSQGWPMHLSNLKTFVETGKAMDLPKMH
ncbi:ArsR/SmtB family transcription factor [Leptospira weilii]|uniref:ArsR/SmtB family transcription factor n=1 Tax=Leptospira weilii TaxID=28184 RepID=UPI0005621959|nr:metalloregulator ArsR/SmtB family transcription factor [Leptospira weilii]